MRMINKALHKYLTYISSTDILGVIPLDLTLHFIIGAIITIICLKKKLKLSTVFILLFIIASLKEINDYFFHWKADWTEYAGDFVVTFGYLFLVYLYRKLKKRT